MKAKLEIGSVVVGCLFVLCGCGVSSEPVHEGDIWAGTADIFAWRDSLGTVGVGHRQSVAILLENRGEAPLRVKQVELEEVSDDEVREFELEGWSPDDDMLVLDPRRAARFDLTYEPQNRVADIARVSFFSNDPENPSYTIEFEPEVAQ